MSGRNWRGGNSRNAIRGYCGLSAARGFSQFLPKELGQPVTVVDRAGAGGQMGATWFLQQPADGYTVMLTPATPFLPVNILLHAG